MLIYCINAGFYGFKYTKFQYAYDTINIHITLFKKKYFYTICQVKVLSQSRANLTKLIETSGKNRKLNNMSVSPAFQISARWGCFWQLIRPFGNKHPVIPKS